MSKLVTFVRATDEVFSNSRIPGKPLAERIANALQASGIDSRSLGLHDTHAWSWFSMPLRASLFVVIGLRDGSDDEWLLYFIPRFNVAAWFARSRYRAAMSELAAAIDRTLHSDPLISDVHWHRSEAFDAGDEASWTTHP